jgi:hypothetical protein
MSAVGQARHVGAISQRHKLTGTQPMAVGEQDGGGVPVAKLILTLRWRKVALIDQDSNIHIIWGRRNASVPNSHLPTRIGLYCAFTRCRRTRKEDLLGQKLEQQQL